MSTSNPTSNRPPGAPSGCNEQQDLYRQREATDYRNNASSDPEPRHHDGSASWNSNVEHQEEYEDDTYVRASHQAVRITKAAIHPCCKSPCPSGQHYSTSLPVLNQAPSEPPLEKSSGLWAMGLRVLGLSTKGESKEEFDEEKTLKNTHPGSSREENEELTKKDADKDKELACCYRELDKQVEEKFRNMETDLKHATAAASHYEGLFRVEHEKNQNTARNHNSQVEVLTTKISEYRSIADGLNAKLSSLKQSNSIAVGSSGAHKDSPAIPPILQKSVFVVKEAAFACAKASYILLKEHYHDALPNFLARVEERFRKYSVEARICSRMFAGFENDSFLDGLDCAQGFEDCLSTNHENTEFFLPNQDLDIRHQRYHSEYDELQKWGLQAIMEALKTNKSASTNDLFLLFCCRKLVSTLASFGLSCQQFMLSENGDCWKESLLYHLATDPRYCDKFLKPFVNLAMATFLLHRLAFQFQPPARIFRYAIGTRFDPSYMENAVFH